MKYDDQIIDEVRDRNDIVDVIGSYVSLKSRGRNSYFGLCPFHNEKSPSFHVDRERQMYYCFGCHQGGNVYTFLMEYNRLTFPEAVQELAQRAGISLPEQEQTPEERQMADARTVLKEMNKQAAIYFHYLLKSQRGEKALAYLRDRGLTDETIRHFGLGYADIYRDDLYQYLKAKGYSDQQMKDSSLVTIDSQRGIFDKFFNRVMFPIMDTRQRVIGFGGRVMGEGQPKYLNSRETLLFDKGRNLYGLNYARRSRENSLILCEGYMDVISLHQAGFTNAVAPLGTAFTETQALLLERYTGEVILSFDSDGAGRDAALRALPILRENGIRARVLSMTPYKDPDELIKAEGPEEYRKRIGAAEPGRLFEIRILHAGYKQSDPDSRTDFIHAVSKYLSRIEDPIERDNYKATVSNKYIIPHKDLDRLVDRYGLSYQMEQANEQYRRKPETEERKKEKQDIRKNQAQSLLLTWLTEEPDLYETIASILSADDFLDPLYHSVALMLFKQLDKGEKVNPARIIDQFSDLEDRERTARIFNAHLQYAPSQEEKSKALTDIVRKIKLASIEEEMTHTSDILRWQELLGMKADIQKLKLTLGPEKGGDH